MRGPHLECGIFEKRCGDWNRIVADYSHPKRTRAPSYSFSYVAYTHHSQRTLLQSYCLTLDPLPAPNGLVHHIKATRETEYVAERGVGNRICKRVGSIND